MGKRKGETRKAVSIRERDREQRRERERDDDKQTHAPCTLNPRD